MHQRSLGLIQWEYSIFHGIGPVTPKCFHLFFMLCSIVSRGTFFRFCFFRRSIGGKIILRNLFHVYHTINFKITPLDCYRLS